MTDAINFFHSFKNFGFFSNPKIDNSSERKLSRELIRDARRLLEKAETETKNADEVKNLMISGGENSLKQNLAKIALWHYEVSAKLYRQAAARYEEASRLRLDQEAILKNQSKKLCQLAQAAEFEVEFLRYGN